MRDMILSEGREIGIDAGCGHLENKRWFRTMRYIGIDVDSERLATAKAKYPNAETLCAKLEETSDVTGDFVLCVQVMNNRYFDVADTLAGIEALVRMVRPGGVLIFNISKRAFSFEGDIFALLKRSFDTIKVRKYGALSAPSTVFSPFIAGLMYLLPVLRKGRGYQKIYYVCQGRRYT